MGPKKRFGEGGERIATELNSLMVQVVICFEATGRFASSCRWALENCPINALCAPISFDNCTLEGLSPTISAPWKARISR